MRPFVFVVTIASLFWSQAAFTQSIPAETPLAARTSQAAAVGRTSMVSSANPLASAAGREILDQGGSAVDAAIAIQLVLGLVEPQSSGVGGGGFMLAYDTATKRVTSFDGREIAPQSATETLFLGADGKPVSFIDGLSGGRPVGIPGAFRLMELAHKRQGKLLWSRLFAPAIRLAEQGFALSPRLHDMLESAKTIAASFPALKNQFYDQSGDPKAVGTILKDPAYARLLRLVAEKGVDAYYTGWPAEHAIEAITTSPKFPVKVTRADFSKYRALERPAVCAPYRQYTVCSMGPPSSGATTVLGTLKMLERFDLKAMGSESAKAIHVIGEAMALAFADREAYLADPAFVDVNVNGLIDHGYLAKRSQLIDPDKAGPAPQAGEPPHSIQTALAPHFGPDIPSTSHWAVVDKAGNAVTWTGSIQAPFGSFLFVDGYILNNELTDFSFMPERGGKKIVNRVEPGKRPRSSMSPTLVFDEKGALVLAVGSAGGSRIIAHVVKTLVAALDWGLDIQKAIDYPNFFKSPQGFELEEGTSLIALKPALEAMGETVLPRSAVSGLHGVQVIKDSGATRYLGGADPRREGVALGD